MSKTSQWEDIYKPGDRKYSQPPKIVLDLVIKAIKQANLKLDTVLEIGCGEGELTNYFTKQGADVTGIDLSSVAIERAKQNNPKAHFIVEDFMRWQPDKQYDLVVANLVLAFVEDKKAFYKKVAEITKEGIGLLLITPTWLEHTKYIPEQGSKVQKISVEYFGTLADAKEYFSEVFAVDHRIEEEYIVVIMVFCSSSKTLPPFSTNSIFLK